MCEAQHGLLMKLITMTAGAAKSSMFLLLFFGYTLLSQSSHLSMGNMDRFPKENPAATVMLPSLTDHLTLTEFCQGNVFLVP